MSAEMLRRAAALMRERAEAAEWTLADPAWYVAEDFTCTQVSEAEHIASWHPAVALAASTWLNSHADIHTLRTCDERLIVPCPALAFARAYLVEI